MLLGGVTSAHAALTAPECLAKKLTAWGNLRKCQATQNGKALQGKSADLAACQTKLNATLTKLDAKATAAAIACRYGVNGNGTVTDYDTGLQWEQKDNLDGIPNPADPHDADNGYPWSVSFPPSRRRATGWAGVHDLPGDVELRDEQRRAGDQRVFRGPLRLAAAGDRGVSGDREQ
jgi:hypothetical protein